MEYGATDWMNIAKYFYWDETELRNFSQRFSTEIEEALAGKASSLSTVKSYLGLPTGNETGTYLALDFGGTNVRVSRIRLLGKHCFMVEKKVSCPLQLEGSYNYMSPQTTVDELFDFIASLIEEAAGGNKAYRLGHTFSFGVIQNHVKDAALIQWSKEIQVQGGEGMMINTLLKQALARRGLENIEPVALLNDTTALLLAAGYQYGCSQIGIICGTGFNICYYEPMLQMIIILEAGGYSEVMRNCWDIAVDEASQRPGYHKLEKMIGGAYLCEVYRQAVMAYLGISQLPAFTTKEMNRIVANESNRNGRLLMGQLWQRIVSPRDVKPLRSIGAAIFVRAAQLTGAACYGVLQHLYTAGEIPRQTIAVEGSVLEYVRGSLFMMEDTLRICQAGNYVQPMLAEPMLVKDGPSVGAAIAAAMVS